MGVLPFANLSGDPAQDYLADALTDELTTGLARILGAFVIARNTTLTSRSTPNKRPLVTLSFATREDAEQARAEVASALPFVPKKTVEQQDIQALHRARQRGGREGALFVRNNPAIRGLIV